MIGQVMLGQKRKIRQQMLYRPCKLAVSSSQLYQPASHAVALAHGEQTFGHIVVAVPKHLRWSMLHNRTIWTPSAAEVLTVRAV
jgi:hypothetical protein